MNCRYSESRTLDSDVLKEESSCVLPRSAGWRNYLNENDSMCDGENFTNVTEKANKPLPVSSNCSKNFCNYEFNSESLLHQNVFKIKNKGFVVRDEDNDISKISSTTDFDVSSCSNGIDSFVINPEVFEKDHSETESLPTHDVAVNGYDCIASKIINDQIDKEVKLKHISFDFPNPNEKEYTLKPCPSLDSSLSLQSCSNKTNHGGFIQTFSSSSANTPFLVTQFRQLVPQSSLPTATPSTPASGIISQASLDSGVLSAHSFDFSQNFSLEVLDKRKRTASSVSSGIGEMWQSSLDGDSSKDTTFPETPVAHRILGAAPSLYNIDGITSETVTSLSNGIGFESFEDFRSVNETSPESTSGFDLHSVGQAWIGHPSFSESSDVTSSVIFPVASCGSSSCIESKNNVERISSSNSQCSNEEKEEAAESCSIFVKSLKCKSTHYANLDTKKIIEKYALNLVMLVLNEAFAQSVSLGWSIKCSGQCNQELCREDFKKKKSSRERKEKENEKPMFSTLGISSCSSSLCWTPELPFSPSHRGYSRTSKRSSLSFSHDSLVGCPPCQDDSHLIKGAISHDVLTFTSKKLADDKRDNCKVRIDDDVYALPVDMVKNFDGPVLQPKVIIQQPTKKTVNRGIRLRNSEGDMRVSSKRVRNNVAKEKGSKLRHKNKHSGTISGENNKRNGFCQVSDYSERNLSSKANIGDKDGEKYSVESQKHCDKPRLRNHRKESKCLDQGKLCKIIPFTSGKNTTKRKELSYDLKIDKKKNRSISSNIRNTLFTLFGLKKTQKEPGNFVNAKNEFIEASSQELSDSSDGMKWGKICPLPSAPPLVTSVKYSAFTEKIGNVKTSSVSSSTVKNEGMKKITNTPEESNSCQRQSNSISPSSLLSCLGHPRTSSVDEHDDQRIKQRKSGELQRGTVQATSSTVTKRALPPLPPSTNIIGPHGEGHASEWKPHVHKLDEGCDFASIIGKVKNYGWYWGPISGEAAEKVLANEPDGSFIVRDSSDYHYIFSLTFRLNGVTRHVRIEHDQGNFSFGGVTRFKSQTIVDFIEKAVEHSRSGRYLFFLHRRPVLGPMRVQLLHPVSRFKHVQSLQHLCRFVIVKQVRKDLIHDLPLPQRLKDYLSSPHYYSEQVEQCMSSSTLSLEGATAASEDSSHIPSPCLHHSSHRRFNNNDKISSSSSSDSNNNDNTNETSIVPQNSSVRFCTNRISLQEPLSTNQFRRTRCSSTQAGSSTAIPRSHRNKEYRLSSSHSSLEKSFLQMYPASPSTISSSSTSGRQNGNFYSSKLSLKRKGTPSFWSPSHSSPSSPVPFDYSPDWLSSSDDFPLNLTSKYPLMNPKQIDLSTTASNNNLVSAVPITFTQSNDILLQLKYSLDKSRLKKSPTERDCSPSASSSTSQSVSDTFVLLEGQCRKNNDASSEMLTPPSPYLNSAIEKNELLSSNDRN